MTDCSTFLLRRFKVDGMKVDRIVLQVNMYWLTASDFWYDIMISRWLPWRHFTRKSAAIWWSSHAASALCICSSNRQFMIYSTFVLDIIMKMALLSSPFQKFSCCRPLSGTDGVSRSVYLFTVSNWSLLLIPVRILSDCCVSCQLFYRLLTFSFFCG